MGVSTFLKKERKTMQNKSYQNHVNELLQENLLSEEFSFFKNWDVAEKLYTIKNEELSSQPTQRQLADKIIMRLDEVIRLESYFYNEQIDIKIGNQWKAFHVGNRIHLADALRIVCLQDNKHTLVKSQMKTICKCVLESLTLYATENDAIQFDDFVLEKGEIHEGFHSTSAPRYRVTDLTLDEVKAQPTPPKEIEKLCTHLAENDKKSCTTLLDMLAYTFMANSNLKRKNTLALWLMPHKDNANVSFLMEFMAKVVGEFSTFRTSLNARGALTEQEKYESAHSLLTLVPDVHVTLDTMTLIFVKTCISSDLQFVKASYKKPEQIQPLQSFIFSSDGSLKVESAMKNYSTARRFLFFRSEKRLQHEKELTSRLSDEKVIRQFRAFLVARALDLIQNHQGRVRVSKKCRKVSESWLK